MESKNGVTLVDESCVIERTYVEESAVDMNKESEHLCNAEVPSIDGISEPVKKAESFNSAEVMVKASATASTSKNSKSTKEPGTLHGDSPKTNKLAKDKPNLKATTPFSRNRKSVLTQSLSLPARGGRLDVTNKSMDVYPVKREAKHAQRHVTSSLNHPNSPASAGIPSKDAKTIPTTRPISPKLGRHKSSVSVINNSSEGDGSGLSPPPNPSPKLGKNNNSITVNNPSEGSGSCRSPHLNREQSDSNKGLRTESDKNVVASKKPIRMSQPKLQTREIAVTKTERKPAKTKTEALGEDKECGGENEESQNPSTCLSECKDNINPESAMDTAQNNNAAVLNSPTLEIMPHEVSAEGYR